MAVDEKLWMYLLSEMVYDTTQDYLTSLVPPRDWIVLLAPMRDGMSIAYTIEENP
jgi:hypothetical protein